MELFRVNFAQYPFPYKVSCLIEVWRCSSKDPCEDIYIYIYGVYINIGNTSGVSSIDLRVDTRLSHAARYSGRASLRYNWCTLCRSLRRWLCGVILDTSGVGRFALL